MRKLDFSFLNPQKPQQAICTTAFTVLLPFWECPTCFLCLGWEASYQGRRPGGLTDTCLVGQRHHTGQVGAGERQSSPLSRPHTAFTLSYSIVSFRDSPKETLQGPTAQTSEYCRYVISLAQLSSWMLCSRNKGWIPTFNEENTVLFASIRFPSPPSKKIALSCRFPSCSSVSCFKTTVLKHVSCHK